MKIIFVTGNKNKLREAQSILGFALDNFDVDIDEIQELDPMIISKHKALQAWNKVKKPIFVLDQSIYINCLNGFPGPLIKWFWEKVTLDKICEIVNSFNDNRIRTETIITYYDGEIMKHFSGQVFGTIPNKPMGNKGWGWDPIFIPDGYQKTFSEMEQSEALPLRSQKIALIGLRNFIQERENK